jgi:polyribonucleotide nucleotidyltransferase
MAIHSWQTEIGGRTLYLETGRMAGLAGGAVVVRYGDTVLLCTATSAEEPREGIDFFPLTVEFEEKMYAAGKIPGGFIKRESRPTEQAILSARLTDRPIRPLFPKDWRNEVQVVSTVLSADQVNDPAICSIIGASAALMISPIPFNGPVAAVRMGYINDELVVNPTFSEMAYSKLDLVLAGTADAIMMVEAGAQELPEEAVLQALDSGHREMQPVIELIHQMAAEVGKPKVVFSVPEDPSLRQAVHDFLGNRLEETIYDPDKATREDATKDLRREVVSHFAERYEPKAVSKAFSGIEKEFVRGNILEHGRRPDRRGLTEVRPIGVEVGVLPRTHGSGLFTRGQTQVLSVCTLGTAADEQQLDTIGIEESKRYMHHYNFPPYSVGETRPMRGPSRRDIGHGALAERALTPVLPSEEDFPYTIRVVSEVVSSNGSTSMASTCGSTLALMDAGVPIKAPVAGIAMGLISDPDDANKYAVLTDIQGVEDALGDMDFKVAGTEAGVTALQMDIKVGGITSQIMRDALMQAREARMFIMAKMIEVIGDPRSELSPFAPRIRRITINPERIRDVIGPGGKMIRKIQEDTKTTIDIEDSGEVLIGSTTAEGFEKAKEWIERLTKDVEPGTTYKGKVTRLMAFGAFVEILPGKEGLVHISELANYRVNQVEDVVNVGDEIDVLVTEIDRQGRINLSRRALLEPSTQPDGLGEESEAGLERGPGPPRRERDFRPRREGFGGGFGGRREGGFPPRREGGGGFGPRREGGFPRREGGGGGSGGYGPRREGPGFGPRREGPGGYPRRGPGGPPRRGPGGGGPGGPGGPRRGPGGDSGPQW